MGYEMLNERGYSVSDAELNSTLDDFVAQFAPSNFSISDLTISKAKVDDRSSKILVFFCSQEKPGVSEFKDYLRLMKEANASRAITIIPQDLSSYSRKALDHLARTSDKYRIEYFLEKELLVNITKHKLVPKHKVLTEEEKRVLLERYNLKETQLPRIEATDPISKFYGLTTGQVVKITRPSETAGRYVTYRMVV